MSDAISHGQPALARIMDYIRGRQLQPGDRLPSERDFAERLHIGRSAVREAIATLVALRVVQARPNSGIYLRRLDKDSSFEASVMLAGLGEVPDATEVAETMSVRAHLELLSVQLACAQRTPQDVARMEQVLRDTTRACEAGDSLGELDTEFHLAVAQATHNSVLVRVLNAFYQLTAPRRALMLGDVAQARRTLDEHTQLCLHIRQGDAVAASAVMTAHMTRARAFWREVLTPTRPGGAALAAATPAIPPHSDNKTGDIACSPSASWPVPSLAQP